MENIGVRPQAEVNYVLLNEARKQKNLTFSEMETRTQVPEGTIKNILLGKTKNPGYEPLRKICNELDIPIEKAFISDGVEQVKAQIETQGIKEGNVSVLALKEIYEHQIQIINKTNELHISNIRSHYQQHHEDLKENYEKRLADKRELIESYKEHIDTVRKEFLICKIALIACVVLFLLVLIAEVMNPNLGWFRY